jgi:hypothetical protein
MLDRHQSIFRVKWAPFRVKKTRQNENLKRGSDPIGTVAPGCANYRIPPSGPIGLPRLSRFSTPQELVVLAAGEHGGPYAKAAGDELTCRGRTPTTPINPYLQRLECGIQGEI